jgi:inorganic phosphate transporter, PiT family
MGVITLALIANGTLPSGAQAPFWVILSCALAISAGAQRASAGWRRLTPRRSERSLYQECQ